jgi:hypothetical protein
LKTINDIIEIVKLGTKCILDKTTYEVIDITPYSKVCSTPQYTLKIIDLESIEERKIQLDKFNKNNPRFYTNLEELLIMDRIEPAWFINRKVVIL